MPDRHLEWSSDIVRLIVEHDTSWKLFSEGVVLFQVWPYFRVCVQPQCSKGERFVRMRTYRGTGLEASSYTMFSVLNRGGHGKPSRCASATSSGAQASPVTCGEVRYCDLSHRVVKWCRNNPPRKPTDANYIGSGKAARAQRARWRKARQQSQPIAITKTETAPVKRTMSAVARRN